MLSCVPYFLFGSSFKESMYEYEKAEDSVVRFFERYHPDAHNFNPHRSGLANELAGSNMIDWPGKPGTMVDDTSTYQVIEHEYMEQDEYDEMLSDFTGYMLRKYIPRAFPKLAPLAKFKLNPSSILGTKFLASIGTPELMEAYELLGKIGEQERLADESNARLSRKLTSVLFPAPGGAASMTMIRFFPFECIADKCLSNGIRIAFTDFSLYEATTSIPLILVLYSID